MLCVSSLTNAEATVEFSFYKDPRLTIVHQEYRTLTLDDLPDRPFHSVIFFHTEILTSGEIRGLGSKILVR
jgi:hypothetical protein